MFIYAIHHVSRTDIECRWNKPKKPTCPAVRDVTEMFPPPKQYCALSREPTQADRSSIYRSLCEYGKFTGLWWILSPEPEPVTLPMLTIEEIIYSDGFLQAHGKEDQLSFFKEKCKIQSSTIQEIAKLKTLNCVNDDGKQVLFFSLEGTVDIKKVNKISCKR